MGNILIIKDGLETSSIPETRRDQALLDFFHMKNQAELRGHSFYVSEAVFLHTYSYGFYYPGFVNLTYEEIRSIPSLKGIEQTTIELLQAYMIECPNPAIAEADFSIYDMPRAESGFSISFDLGQDYIFDFPTYCDWERRWNSQNPDKIEWKDNMIEFMPRPDLTKMILIREINSHKCRKEVKDMLEAGCKHTHIFHDGIVARKGTELKAYFIKIAHEVLLANYYTHEQLLSQMESKQTHSSRHIYSLITKSGKRHFISLDFGHGMLEICDEHGVHIGEYRIDGTFNSPATPTTHSLHCVKNWSKHKPNCKY